MDRLPTPRSMGMFPARRDSRRRGTHRDCDTFWPWMGASGDDGAVSRNPLRNPRRRAHARECARIYRQISPAGLDGSCFRRGGCRGCSRDQVTGSWTVALAAHRCVASAASAPGGVYCPVGGARRVVPCQGLLVFAGGFGRSGWSGGAGLRGDARQTFPARSDRRSAILMRCCGRHCEMASPASGENHRAIPIGCLRRRELSQNDPAPE